MILSIILFFIAFLCVCTLITECKKRQVTQAIFTVISVIVIMFFSIANLL
ncbi:DUF2759 family protein [Terribacillus saccharophilus]|nr:DUF2759 family protein [Terribacillus goriensis]